MNEKYFYHGWILYQEIANESKENKDQKTDGLLKGLKPLKVKEDNPETNKHIPFTTETEVGYDVIVGKTGYHSTTADHHTMFIDLVVDDKYFYRQYIAQDTNSEASFAVPKGKKSVVAYAFCNLHGIWKYQFKL